MCVCVSVCLIVTARQRSCGKVMFSQVSVCSQRGRRPHVTITHHALDLTVQPSPPKRHLVVATETEACMVSKARDTHPTRMLTCLFVSLCFLTIFFSVIMSIYPSVRTGRKSKIFCKRKATTLCFLLSTFYKLV